MQQKKKRFLNRLLAYVLTICMVVTLVPMTVFASEPDSVITAEDENTDSAVTDEEVTEVVSGNDLPADTEEVPGGSDMISAPTNLRWENDKICWDAVAGTDKYDVSIQKDGVEVKKVTLTGFLDYAVGRTFAEYGPGIYTAEIKAVSASGVRGNAATSPAFNYTVPRLDAPTGVRWDGKVAKWNAVKNSEGYIVQLYINGVSRIYLGNVFGCELDMTSYIDPYEPAEYYFSVTAKTTDWQNHSYSLPATSAKVQMGTSLAEVLMVDFSVVYPKEGAAPCAPVINSEHSIFCDEEDDQYPGKGYRWLEGDENGIDYSVEKIDKFKAGKIYVLAVEVCPEAGYKYHIDKTDIMVNGMDMSYNGNVDMRRDKCICHFAFYIPKNDENNILKVEVNVDVPVAGEAPCVPVIKTAGVEMCTTEGDYYPGVGYAWYECDEDGYWVNEPENGEFVEKFEAGKTYELNIEMKSKAGYQFVKDTFLNGTQVYIAGKSVMPSAEDSIIDGTWVDDEFIDAYYIYTVPEAYTVKVTSGRAVNASGKEITKASVGSEVTLIADAVPEGKVFDKWVIVSGGVKLANETATTTTFKMPGKAVEVKATYKQREPGPGEYIGNINTDLKSFDLKQNEKGAYYLYGEIIVVEWVDGKSTVPKVAPTMTFKSTDGKDQIEVFVTATGTNTYYFDRFIEGLDANKEYVFEIASGDPKNISQNRFMNVTILTSTYGLPTIKNLGKIGEQKICYYTASNGDMRLFRRTKEYVGNINSELKYAKCETNNIGNFVTGEIVVVEWENGVSTVPFETPVMRFKSKKGVDMDVFVIPTGTNTYYFDRCLEDLDTSDEFYFTITSGDPKNVSPNKSMIVTTTDMKNKEGTLWETPKQYVKYKTNPNNGQMIIYAEDK